MKPRDYHNEIDPYAAQWTRNLMKKGLIPDGFVDERDIRDVQPMDLWGFTRCHFFSGIAGWAYALRLAGVPDDFPLWTGSCPCQPFSEAGKGAGFDDERHLWPAWQWLISQSRPPIILGEQTPRAIRMGWLDLVANDLERLGYAFGAVLIPACAVGAKHIRERIWFLADAASERRINDRRQQCSSSSDEARSLYRWPSESGFSRTSDGILGRMALVRAFGNSIVPQVAAAFIEAALACRP